MKNVIFRSVDGRQLPQDAEEIAVYWPDAGVTDIYAAEGFEQGQFRCGKYADERARPEIIHATPQGAQ